MIGIVIAFGGVATIVLRGSIDNALALNFNAGDLLVLAGARSAGPAIRSSTGRNRYVRSAICRCSRWSRCSARWQTCRSRSGRFRRARQLPAKPEVWAAILGIVLISSLLAFSTYQLGVRALGASMAGVFMYLLPVYGVGLAIVFLGEEFHGFHAAGIALVMAGVMTATFPVALLRGWVSRTA